MDSQIISIKSVILPTQISDVVVNSEGFSIKVHSVGLKRKSDV